MAEGKWIEGLSADTPLVEAAGHVLNVRLHTVGQALPKASQESDKDPEYVHQLRVATRRADAAVRIFRSCLPRKVYKSARKRLRRMRRAAGAARDWDVFLIALDERRPKQPAKEQAGLDFLFGYAHGQRTAAQVELTSVGDEEHATFDAFRHETAAAVHPANDLPADANLVDLARPLLTGLLGDLEWAASGDLEDYAHLHLVRIAGKRLRYAMEVFADCFALSFRGALYPRVEEMQETLGRANDSHVAEGRLADLRRRMKLGWAAEWKAALPPAPAAAGAEAVRAMVGGVAEERGAGADGDAGRRWGGGLAGFRHGGEGRGVPLEGEPQ
jgi:CHAD domain-containing protein